MSQLFINRCTLQGVIDSDPYCSRNDNRFMCTFLLKIVDQWKTKDGEMKEFATLIPINLRDEELYSSVKDDLKKGGVFLVEGAFRKRAIQREGQSKNDWLSEIFITKYTGWVTAIKAEGSSYSPSAASPSYQEAQGHKPSYTARKQETKGYSKYDGGELDF